MITKDYSSSNTYTDRNTGVKIHADLGVQIYFDAPISYVNGYAYVYAAPVCTELSKFDRHLSDFASAGWTLIATGNVDYHNTAVIAELLKPHPHLQNLPPVVFTPA